MGELEIAWVDAEVGKEDEKLILNPPSSTPPPHRPILVGDLKLADFKQLLENNGLQVVCSPSMLSFLSFNCSLYLKGHYLNLVSRGGHGVYFI